MKNIKVKILISVAILGILFYIFKSGIFHKITPQDNQTQKIQTNTSSVSQNDKLQVVSTNPDPLEGAILLPTQSIEVTLSKEVVVSELKHKFDPETKNTVEVLDNKGTTKGKVFKITFKDPLKPGVGYTLFIETNTHTESGETLDKQYVYHFKTISYKGI